jgi:GNAT superfamily N-acetyltransferase
MKAQEFINEAFDQPYKILRWEKGDYGDVDAIARLPVGTFLSVMFTKGFSQETKEEAWSVEFFRNNSQEKTGEGDQQRVFATVLSAVQTFVSDRVPGAKGRYKPNKIFFSASKEVKPDEDQRKAMTRARLYDSLVQRYARAWGFRAFRADTGKQVMYELSRIKPVVAETINTDILNKKFKHKQVIGDYTYTASVEMFIGEPLLNIKAYDGNKEIGHILFEIWYLDGRPGRSHIESGGTEVAPEYRGQGVASTMYAYAKMLGNDIMPSWSQTSKGKAMWAAWEKAGDAKHLVGTSMESTVSENFDDGKVSGKSRPGRVKRSGASCDGSVTDLRQRAKNASGERARMYHWCANMKSGRNKSK